MKVLRKNVCGQPTRVVSGIFQYNSTERIGSVEGSSFRKVVIVYYNMCFNSEKPLKNKTGCTEVCREFSVHCNVFRCTILRDKNYSFFLLRDKNILQQEMKISEDDYCTTELTDTAFY